MVAMSIALIIVGPPQYRCFELRLLPFAPSDRPAQSVGELALAHVGDRLADLRQELAKVGGQAAAGRCHVGEHNALAALSALTHGHPQVSSAASPSSA